MRRTLVFLVGMATACGGSNVAMLVEETGDAGGDAVSVVEDSGRDAGVDSGAVVVDSGVADSGISTPDSGMQETADPPDTGAADTSTPPIVDSGGTTFNGCKITSCASAGSVDCLPIGKIVQCGQAQSVAWSGGFCDMTGQPRGPSCATGALCVVETSPNSDPVPNYGTCL